MARRWQDWPEASRPVIDDVHLVVGEFEVSLEGPPNGILKIKVLKNAAGRYMGVPNFMVQDLDAADPYWSIEYSNTIDEAFWDTIQGLFAFGEDVFWIGNPSY